MNEDLKKALEVLKNGGVILYPTDTIWGLGCDATNESAIEKIYAIKKRNDNKKMLVLANTENMVERYVEEMPEIAYDLIAASVKPLTIIYEHAKNLPSSILGENNSIGFRITEESFTKSLLERFRKPIISTSANIHTEPSPANFSEISEEIIKAADYVVKYRQDEMVKNVASSIIKLNFDGTFKIIRE